ncbi:three-Cys-motif partner protein TcmP [Streptomyces sp. NPDC091204]|uniref:three-Cys-motif partner protein TcmP n=1 Tax=Streptomyces sp. NPDC091204 TaxID=3155299 RepID=UPI00343F8D2E
MAGPKTTLWELEPHTRAKHDLLRRYLGGWFPVLSAYNGRIVFLDGFAGPGAYENGEPGSPLIALDALLTHAYFPRMSCEFLFFFCEADPKRFESLKELIEVYKAENYPWPSNVKVEAVNSPFEQTATDLLSHLSTQKKRLAPTFAFVDPFGFSGLPMNLLADLLSFSRCELFVNYMVDFVNRFAGAGNVDHHLTELFGTDEYKHAASLRGKERQQFLHDLYQRQLSEVCGLTYVQSFAMINRTGHIGYYLFHGTRDVKGVELMKDAMWKVDPGGGFTFSDRLAGQDVLFTEVDIDVTPLRAALLREFAGRTVNISRLEEFTLVNTPYRKTHLRKPVLSPLEREGLIQVGRPGRSGFPEGTRVTFSSY